MPPPILTQAACNLGHIGKRDIHVFPHIPETLGSKEAEGPLRFTEANHISRILRRKAATAFQAALLAYAGEISLNC